MASKSTTLCFLMQWAEHECRQMNNADVELNPRDISRFSRYVIGIFHYNYGLSSNSIKHFKVSDWVSLENEGSIFIEDMADTMLFRADDVKDLYFYFKHVRSQLDKKRLSSDEDRYFLLNNNGAPFTDIQKELGRLQAEYETTVVNHTPYSTSTDIRHIEVCHTKEVYDKLKETNPPSADAQLSYSGVHELNGDTRKILERWKYDRDKVRVSQLINTDFKRRRTAPDRHTICRACDIHGWTSKSRIARLLGKHEFG